MSDEPSGHRVLYTDNRFAQGLADAVGIPHFPLRASDGLNLAESKFEQHLILDDSLLNQNPDFIEQRDLGALWCERLDVMITGVTSVSAELDGLTGCREVFVPATSKATSVFTRLAKLLGR